MYSAASSALHRTLAALLPERDLLRDRIYRRLWISILISGFGSQITLLAIPLTAAVLLHATPLQMGSLAAVEVAAFALFSLPVGVWLDRLRKLPVYFVSQWVLAGIVLSVPVAWSFDVLSMAWLYAVAFAIGTVHTLSGSAGQIVLTQIVDRERLVEAHARNALATSTAEVMGPGAAGALIRLFSAPLALVADAILLSLAAVILRGIRVVEQRPPVRVAFGAALGEGLRFVAANRLLMSMALVVGVWHMAYHAAQVVQILYATRSLGLSEGSVGLSYVAIGLGTVLAGMFGHRLARRIGPGPAMITGILLTGLGWGLVAVAPVSSLGMLAFVAMLACFGVGATVIFINFLSLRQAVTPAPLLGRMTSTMRWLILLPAGPGALLGGWLGEHVGLRASLAFASVLALLLALVAWRMPIIRNTRTLPRPA